MMEQRGESMDQENRGRRQNQRQKAFLAFQILCRETDDEHVKTAVDLATDIERYGVPAEAHSVGRDIRELQRLFDQHAEKSGREDEGESLGYELVYDGSKHGFKVSRRPLSFDQLQTIAASIRASRYLSKKEEQRIIRALGVFCSRYQLETLEKDEYWTVRDKTPNDKVITNIRRINEAIQQDRKVSFQYMKYTIQKRNEQTPRRKGIDYVLSPFKILAVDGYFYLIAYDGKKIVRYRIDRMKTVWVEEDQPREGKKEFEKIDSRTYTQKLFGMMGGEEKHVSLRFTIDLLDTVVDRLGASVASYQPDGDRHFKVSADVAVSDQFYAWVCGFRKRVAIIDPPEVVEGFQQFLNDIQGRYSFG